MAVRQESASGTGRVKRPRIQVVISEPINDQIEALAKERGESVSATARWILERHFDKAEAITQRVETDSDPEKFTKLLKMMQLAKEAGVL